MPWVPLVAAVLLGLVLMIIQVWQHHRQLDRAQVYRSRFCQLVSQLDSVTASVNQLESYIAEVREPKLLDYYESTLRILETLLSAIRKIPAHGTSPDELTPALFLARDTKERVARTQAAFRRALGGRQVDLAKLYGQPTVAATEGCYFCSRPIVRHRFAMVRVRLDGVVQEVLSCRICREELRSTKRVKVLYFMRGGKPVHWSQVSDYQPSEDFWSINKKSPVRKERRLELVHSDMRPLNGGDGEQET